MTDAAAEMDAIYRVQRHIYDASRKYYLLGRDGMLAGLDPPPGGTVPLWPHPFTWRTFGSIPPDTLSTPRAFA